MSDIEQPIKRLPPEVIKYCFVSDGDLIKFFGKWRPIIENQIRKDYQQGRISKGVAIDQQKILVTALDILLKLNEYSIDPADLLTWIEGLKEEVNEPLETA